MVHFLKQAAFSEIEVKIDMCTLYSVDCAQVFDRHIQYSEYCYFLVVQYLRNYWDKHIPTKLPPPPNQFSFSPYPFKYLEFRCFYAAEGWRCFHLRNQKLYN